MGRRNDDFFICVWFAFILSAGCFLCMFLEKPDYSYNERRYLAEMPELSVDTVSSGRFMSDFEDYALDTFPFRERFRKLRAWTTANIFLFKDHHGMYLADGFLAAMEYPMQQESLERAVRQFAEICAGLTKENHVYLSVIPDKNCFLGKESGHLTMDYEEFEHVMRQEAQFAEYITISDLLDKEDYYRTDPHWRQEKITDVAKRLAVSMGTTLNEDYQTHTLSRDFYGAYYGQAMLAAAPDTLRYLTGDAIDGCSVYDWQNQRPIPVYDKKKAADKDPYECFLSGPLSLLTIKNPNARNEKRLIIFRDSFGSANAPLLISGYEQITLADLRYIRPEILEKFISFEKCDVLFLYSTLVLNSFASNC